MSQTLAGETSPVAPFAIDAEAEPGNPGGWPKGGVTEVRLSNPHLQYVVTWYGVALTLIGVFIAFARQRLAALENSPENR
jgi:surfeit locus 1 family protein